MKVKLITYGCAANQADSELMAGLLIKTGHELVNEKPDAYLVNTCTVKQTTELKIKKLLKSLKGKKVVIAGCMSNANPEMKSEFPEFTLIGVNDCCKVVKALEGGKSFISREPEQRLCKPKKRADRLIEIIPVSQGCLGNCAYCKTKQAKGNLISYTASLIIKQAVNALRQGVKELWITSQDCGCYGFDNGTNLVKLMNKILSLPFDFRVRLGMINPNHALKLKGLASLFKHNKLYKFVHLPVQSGSDKVLRDMCRQYTIKEFKKIINSFKKVDPNITISTDVICGYPTETDDDWNKTVKLIKWLRPGVLNISRFFARPGTKAFELKQHHSRVVKERSRELTKLFNKMKSNNVMPKTSTWFTGRTDYYKQLV